MRDNSPKFWHAGKVRNRAVAGERKRVQGQFYSRGGG